MRYKVVLHKSVIKAQSKIPSSVLKNLVAWIDSVETLGLPKTQCVKGYHDEPLKGALAGKRSVRLNLQWRLIYQLNKDDAIIYVMVERITPHDYRTS